MTTQEESRFHKARLLFFSLKRAAEKGAMAEDISEMLNSLHGVETLEREITEVLISPEIRGV
jgi:hypothetical protein